MDRDQKKERERGKTWREKNREQYRAYLKAWYVAHREELREKARARYRQKQEEMKAKHAAYREANREKIREHNRALYAKKKQLKELQEGEKNMLNELDMEICPRCGSPAGMKAQGRIHVAGCTKIRCRNWLGKQDAPAGETAEAAAAAWNELARDQRAELGEQAKGVEVEKVKSSEDSDSSGLSTVQPFNRSTPSAGETPAPPEEEAVEEEAAVEEEEAEQSSRFWLELDGKWYFLDGGHEGCEGCAFHLAFGQRVICAAASSSGDDFEHAATLCQAVVGVWREGDSTP